ncbi:MAG: hypothetical protein IIZ46_06300 [Clostridia bacterium]|nr:hypothetical protein [Clostridia bacterium]
MQTVQEPTNKFSVKPFSKGLQGCGGAVCRGQTLPKATAPTEPAGETSVPTIAAGALQPF